MQFKSDALHKPQFGKNDVEIIEQKDVYQGFHRITKMRLRHRLYEGGWSEVIEREVSAKGSAASVVVYDPELDAVCLVEQFRVATLDVNSTKSTKDKASEATSSPWSLEIVAGMLDKEDENPEELVRRELQEEAGLNPSHIEKITSYWVSPGGSSARMHIYVALCDLQNAGGIYGLEEESEDILAEVVPLETVYQYSINEESSNAATLIGLQWLTLNRERLYHKWKAKE